METNFNLGSLKTIQAPLLEYLNSAHDNLIKNIDIIREDKKIPTNHDYITVMEKLDKTFNMIGLHSLSVIFNLNREALIKVSQVTYDTEKHVEILNAVLIIVNNTKTYIKSLINGENDNPTKFFENYSAVAHLIRKEVNIKDLFNPHLELRSNIQSNIRDELRRGVVVNHKNRKNLLENVKVVESTFSNNLTVLFNVIDQSGEFTSNEDKESYQLICKNIYEKFDVAQKLKISKSHYVIFGLLKLYICILSPVFNQNFVLFTINNSEKIKSDLYSIKDLLVDLNNHIKNLEDESKTGSLKVKDEIIKNVLFNILDYVKVNPVLMDMSVYRELSMYFDLDYYAEQLLDTKMNIIEELEINLPLIEKLFNDLKEDFTLLDSKKKSNKESLAQHIQRIININNKLAEAILPVKEVHILTSQLSATLSMIKNGNLKLTELIERELSIALVLIEYGVNNIIKNNVENRYKSEFGQQSQVQISRIKAAELDDKKQLSMLPMPKLDSASQKLDEKKSFAKIFEQISISLIEMEESLDNIINNNGENIEEVNTILKPLVEMKGILSILRKEEVAPILNKILEIWRVAQEGGRDAWQVNEDIKESIVLISGFSLFVEAFKEENDDEAEEIYENIITRFNSKLNKTSGNSIEEIIEEDLLIVDSEKVSASDVLFDENVLSIVNLPVDIVNKDSSSVFSLEDDLINQEEENQELLSGILSKSEIIKEFNNFKGDNVSRLVFLIRSYLSLSGAHDSIVNSGALLGRVLGNISLDQSFVKSININNLKSFISIDALIKILKNKNKVTNETKQEIRIYLNNLPGTVENQVSVEGHKIHNALESYVEEMLNKVAINNLPIIDVNIKNEEQPLNITLMNINELTCFKEKSNDEELLEFFLEEVFEIIDSLNTSIKKVERNYEDKEEITNIRRYFHTLKGSGRTIGLDYWGEAAWMTEQTLNRVLCGDLEMTKELMSAIKYMKDFFEVMVSKLKEVGEINVDLVTVKMLWLPLNNKMTHHVEIDLPSSTARLPEIQVNETVLEPLIKDIPVFYVKEDSDKKENGNDNSYDASDFEDKHSDVISFELDIGDSNPIVDMKNEDNSIPLEFEISVDSVDDTNEVEVLDFDNGLVNGELVDEKPEYILIDNKEVPLYIFNLYKDESLLHIKNLKSFVHSNYSDSVQMDSQFMVHAHTLGSISKTVNLQKIAHISSILEDISMLALDREITLSSEDMNILRHSIDNLEIFQNFNEVADISFYETLVFKLNELYQKLTAREDYSSEEQPEFYNFIPEDNILEKVELEIGNNNSINRDRDTDSTSEENYLKLKLDIDQLMEKSLKEVTDYFENKLAKLEHHNEQQNINFAQATEIMSKNHGVELNKYSQELVALNEKIESLEKINKQMVKHYDEIIKNLKSDLSDIKIIIKNKGSSWLSKLFGN